MTAQKPFQNFTGGSRSLDVLVEGGETLADNPFLLGGDGLVVLGDAGPTGCWDVGLLIASGYSARRCATRRRLLLCTSSICAPAWSVIRGGPGAGGGSAAICLPMCSAASSDVTKHPLRGALV